MGRRPTSYTVPPAIPPARSPHKPGQWRDGLEGADGMPDHGPAMDVQVLLGVPGAHAGTHAGGGNRAKMAGQGLFRNRFLRVLCTKF